MFVQSTSASASVCAELPVSTEAHAICLAKAFSEQPSPPPWELAFTATEREQDWLVHFSPRSSNVRGGAADLSVEKATGKVVFIQGYK